jgi:Icc protein
MPIQLPPLSRRAFLRRALLTGAGLALAPQLHAAMRRTDATSFALLADPHIAANPAKIMRTINMTDHFNTVAREIIGLSQRPAGAFIAGDCALSSGEPGEYTQLTALLDPLRAAGLTLHLALGNHDQRENFWTALASQKATKRPVADKQVALIKSKHLNWFLLDSLEKTLQTPGALGEDQLKWLAATLDANRNVPAVIVVHHNPGEDNKIGGLKDTNALLEIIRPCHQVKAWIYGHTHNWKVTQDSSGVHLVNLPPVAYIFREGDPSGWVHATTRRDGLKLELRTIDPNHKAQGQLVDLKWREA